MSPFRHFRYVILSLIIVWLIILFYIFSDLLPSTSLTTDKLTFNAGDNTIIRLSRAAKELEALKSQNEELRQLINNIKQHQSKDCPNYISTSGGSAPSQEFEIERRRAESNVKELWYYVHSELTKLDKQSNPGKIKQVQSNVASMKRVVINNLHKIGDVEGRLEWRQEEHRNLTNLIQQRIHYLQNPGDCNTARKLVCNVNKGCGYGCQIHHIVYCFMVAYGSRRTLILESKGWRYSSHGWESVFKPLSDTCTSVSGSARNKWSKNTDSSQVVDLPIVDSVHPKPPYLPLAVPKEIAPRLLTLHGDPPVWWVGQFLLYMLRYQPEIQEDINEAREKMGFKSPVVGIHVRRTDKVGTEAAFHSLEEYMSYVDDYYDELEMRDGSVKGDKRRVYIATDDPALLPEAKEKYGSKYDVLGDIGIAKSAGLSSRYSDASLRGIIMDIHFLSLTDYLVCTFSSQVCRLAYEIMNALKPDASQSFRSLDDIYYFGGQNAHNRRAWMSHTAENGGEIDLEVGDLIGVAGNHWDGYSKGTNKRTGKVGLYPSYKVRETLDKVNFPNYPPKQ